MGRSDLFLKLEIIKKTVGIIAILITMWISVQAMAYSFLVTTILNQIINSWPNKKLLNYSYLEQVKDMMPQILLSLGMGAAIYAVSFLHLSASLTLLIQIPLGVLAYWSGSKIFHVESYTYIIEMVKNFKKRKKKA